MSHVIADPWTVQETDFPSHGTPEEQIRFLLNYAVLAPSGHNTQPWLFKIQGDCVDLYADRSRALPVVDPDDRELTISCGAALFHLRMAMAHFGFQVPVTVLPAKEDQDRLARVCLGARREPREDEQPLFAAIPKRRTNRRSFEDRAVPTDVLSSLRQGASSEGARFVVVEGGEKRNKLADRIAEGDRIQGADKRFRRELAAWLHPNRTRSRDGIPGYGFGFGDVLSYGMPLLIRTFDWGKGQAAKDRQLAEGSPVLAVLVTDEDAPAAWLACGQALARILLQASAAGVHASFLNQPIEVPELRLELKELLGETGFPQLLLRMGYGAEVPRTPRRPVNEVLTD